MFFPSFSAVSWVWEWEFFCCDERNGAQGPTEITRECEFDVLCCYLYAHRWLHGFIDSTTLQCSTQFIRYFMAMNERHEWEESQRPFVHFIHANIGARPPLTGCSSSAKSNFAAHCTPELVAIRRITIDNVVNINPLLILVDDMSFSPVSAFVIGTFYFVFWSPVCLARIAALLQPSSLLL